MIKEKALNAGLKDWLEKHNAKWQVFPKDFLEETLRKYYIEGKYAIQPTDKFWSTPQLISYGRESRIGAYREIFSHLFNKYLKNVSEIYELGSGRFASLHKMVPDKHRGEWTFVELSHDNLWILNKSYLPKKLKRNNGANLICASFHDLPFQNEKLGSILEMNSFETTVDKENVVKESFRVLENGGYLVSMQDVIPNEAGSIYYEFVKNGRQNVAGYVSGDSKSDALLTKQTSEIVGIAVQTNSGLMDCRSYHINSVRQIAESLGMKSLFCGLVEGWGIYRRQNVHDEINNFGHRPPSLEGKYLNSFDGRISLSKLDERKDIPEGKVYQHADITVGIFQK